VNIFSGLTWLFFLWFSRSSFLKTCLLSVLLIKKEVMKVVRRKTKRRLVLNEKSYNSWQSNWEVVSLEPSSRSSFQRIGKTRRDDDSQCKGLNVPRKGS
jgi:hypothetical protein